MSTKRGNTTRNRPQKHQNRTAFKNDLHDKTPQMKLINSLYICEVCEHCKAVIEWKIKYKKYKPLTKPKTCTKCQNRNVKKAYHVICRDCAIKEKICAKCLKSGEDVRIEPPQPSEEEQLKLKVEMDRLIKSLPERKRRSFLRYMKKGKHKESESIEEENDEEQVENRNENVEDENNKEKGDAFEKEKKKISNRIPHTRDELLAKIEELKIADDEEFYEDVDSFFDDSDLDDISSEEDKGD